MRPLLFFAATLAVAAPAWPALTWETTQVDIDATPEQEKAEAVFRFTNTGESTITITGTHASCGCTTPELDQKTYPPQASGELRVSYAFGDATGKQQKTITVSTDDPGQPHQVLVLNVSIPELFHIQPRFVLWRRDEEASAKTITIRAQFPEIARPTAVETRDARFTVALVPNETDPAEYAVTITPADTSTQMFTSVTVTTSAPEGRHHTLSLFATVR